MLARTDDFGSERYIEGAPRARLRTKMFAVAFLWFVGATACASQPINPAVEAELRSSAVKAGVPCKTEEISEVVENAGGKNEFAVVCRGQTYVCEPKDTSYECTLGPMPRPQRVGPVR